MWKHWKQFLQHVEYRNNEFFDNILTEECTHLLASFAQAICNRKHFPCAGRPLVAGTVSSAIDHVASTFRDYDCPNPQLDRDNRTSRLYSNNTKATNKQTRQSNNKKQHQRVSFAK